MPVIGSNGSQALATKILNTFPKLELATILMYLIVLPCVMRPVMTASTIICRDFCVRMMSAQDLATEAPLSTDMPASAKRRATQSFMPSPSMPTTSPWDFRLVTTWPFWLGVSLAKILQFFTISSNSLGIVSYFASFGPVMAWRPVSATSLLEMRFSVRQTFIATPKLSPVRTRTSTPSS